MTNVPFSTNYDVISATDPTYGADRTGASDSTAALQLAINAAFGVCAFVGGTGGVSSTTLTVTSIVTNSGGVTTNFGTIRAGVTVWSTVGSAVIQPGGPGGAGSYTISPALNIPNGTTLWCSNGSHTYLNKKLYIPSGTYTTTAPLYWTGLTGIHVFGGGQGATIISFQGNPALGNIMTPAQTPLDTVTPTYTPVLMFEGVGYGVLEGITTHTVSANASVNTMIGWLFYQNGLSSYCGTNSVRDASADNMYVGMLGDQGAGNVDNFVFANVTYTNCALAGLRASGQNVINWQVYGGGAGNCGWLSTYDPGVTAGNCGAAFSSPSGTIAVLSGLSCSQNNWDVVNQSGQQCMVFGGSFEGAHVTNISSVSVSGTGPFTVTLNLSNTHNMTGTPKITVYGVTPSGYNGQFTGTVVNSTTLTYSLASNPGAVTTQGSVFQTNTGSLAVSTGSMSVHGVAYRGTTNNGFVADSGFMFVSASANSPNAATGAGNVFRIHNGIMTFENGWFQFTWGTSGSSINMTGASTLAMRGNFWSGAPPPSNLFANCVSGNIVEYDQALLTTVAKLPAASAIFQGCRGSVTDGATSLAWGATVSGGGSTFYQVVCDGSAWTVTGK